MTARESTAPEGSRGAQGTTCQRQANHKPVPKKWQRVLGYLLTGRSFNRFEAEKPVETGGASDHCLHSTISEIQGKGVTVSRKMEQVPGYQGIATQVMRYWLDLGDVENVNRAKDLLSVGLPNKPTSESKAADEEKRQRAIEQERRLRAQRVPA